MLSAAAVDRMHDGPRTHYDRELTAQGIGNVLCGAFGALPMTGVIVRSAANVQAGSATRVAAILHGLWILVFAALLPWLLRMTPVACLAGILVYTGIKMVDPAQMKNLAKYGPGTVMIYIATTIAIVATDLLTGVLIGFGLSLLRLALQAAQLTMSMDPRCDKTGTLALSLHGSATFLKVPALTRVLATIPPKTRLLLKIDQLRHIDQACLEVLKDWGRNAAAESVGVGCRLECIAAACRGAVGLIA